MYRIVHNEQSDAYRVEKRGWFSWSFVTTAGSADYLGFRSLDEARAWVRQRTEKKPNTWRRWKVVQDCSV